MGWSRHIPALILALAGMARAAEYPVGSPIAGPLFELGRELYGRGLLEGLEYARPESTETPEGDPFARIADNYNLLAHDLRRPTGRPRIEIGAQVMESALLGDRDENYLKAFPSLDVVFGRRLSASVLYRIDGELGDDQRYAGKTWRGFSGLAENATIEYNDGPFTARFGIERISWGHGEHGNLMFSRQAAPMAVMGLAYRRWIVEFQSVVGFLNPLDDQLDLMENDTSFFTSQQRYLSAHSITLRPLGGLSVSLREAVLYGGPGRRLEPAYLFPLVWYHGEQLNSRMDDNTLFGLAADYRLDGRLWAYGEILIDDFQIEHETRGGYEPNQLGYLGGVETYDLLIKRSGAGMEYSRINNWTFNQARAHNRYINANYPIGYPDGPDIDAFAWRFWHWPADFLKVTYRGSHSRQGEGRIDTPWSRPWLEVDEYREPFPSGTVERLLSNSLEALILWHNRFWGNLRLDYSDIDNVGNNPGSNQKIWEFRVDIGLKLPPFKWEL